MSSSVLNSNLLQMSQMLQRKIISASELCAMCLERLQNTRNLNAFITISTNLAKRQAAAADDRINKGERLGPLDGIPLAFKDNFCTNGIRTTCASNMLKDFIAPYNSTVVQRLLDQGIVLVGKTNLDEFAMGSGTVDSAFGPTKNPWRSGLKYKLLKKTKCGDASRNNDVSNEISSFASFGSLKEEDWLIAGGSSGGSAVAVTSGVCFGALGSDTGGSTRNPAALCGIVGLKPTYGLLSRYGLIPLTNSLDVPGILTKTTDDAALILSTIAGYDHKDSTTSKKSFLPFTISSDITVKGIHIGIPKEYECPGMSREVLETWKSVADKLGKSGAKVTSVSLPHTKYSVVCYSVLCSCEVASNFACYDGIEYGCRASDETSTENLFASTRHNGFGEVVRGRILAGNYFLLKKNFNKYYIKAMKLRQLIREDFLHTFQNGIDILLTPVTLSDAVPYSVWMKKDNREHNATDDFCTLPVNMAGLPAVSIPCYLSKRGLPLSLQVIGRPYQEQALLTTAKWIEQQMNFPTLDIHC